MNTSVYISIRYHSLRKTTKLKIMNKLITNKNLIIINFGIVTYFIILYLLSRYKIDSILIGFFGELLTIPFLIAQIVFTIIGIRYIIKKKSKNYLLIFSLITLITCTIFTIGSLLKYRL